MKLWNSLSKSEKIERWENVGRVVRGIAEDPHARSHHWNMGLWAVQNECGTVACAAGHCALDPYFQEQGFKARPHPRSTVLGGGRLQLWQPGRPHGFNSDDMIDGDGRWSVYGWGETIEDFFGYQGTHAIFANPTQRSPSMVLEEIDLYLSTLRGSTSE
jgi:hypothetical protein